MFQSDFLIGQLMWARVRNSFGRIFHYDTMLLQHEKRDGRNTKGKEDKTTESRHIETPYWKNQRFDIYRVSVNYR